MKKLVLSVFTIALLFASANLIAQDSNEKSEVKKDINVTEKNGDVQVIVKETKDGKVTKQVFEGEEAEEYLKNETKGSSLFLKSGDEDSNVIIMEMDGDATHSHSWISDEDIEFDFDIDMGELNTDLEKLQDELEELNKEEIAERIDEIIKMREEMTEMHVIKMEELHHNMDDLLEINENISVEVIEEDGVMIITKTIGENVIVEEIILDEDTKGKRIIVMSSSDSKGDNYFEHTSKITNGDIDVSVFPTPNEGKFTIDVELKNDEEAEIRVIDASGKEVYKKKIKGAEKHSLKVDLKKPSSGMYVIIVEQGNEVMKLKTIVD